MRYAPELAPTIANNNAMSMKALKWFPTRIILCGCLMFLAMANFTINVSDSATPAGLATAIACAGFEGVVVEMSWYGHRPVEVNLGGAFHSRRLKLVSSQVGHVAPSRRPRWTHRRRIETAVRLLGSLPALDALVAEEIAFEDAPAKLPRIFGPGGHGLAPVIRYPQP